MRRTTVNALKEAKMVLRLYGKHWGRFFKYNPDGEDAIEIILANQDKLTQYLYNLPNELLYNKTGDYIGFYAELLKGYRTIYDYIRMQESYDKDMVAANVLSVVEEFESIDLNYYDIHDENFMINKNGDFKVVDVDGADLILSDSSRIDKMNNFWDFVFEMYLFEFYPEHPVRLNAVWMFEEADTYFSNEFLEYIDGVIRDDTDILTVSPRIYLPEFYDKEKIEEFSKRLELDCKYYGK